MATSHVPRASRAVILYDRDCGFCRWTLAGLLALDRDRRLRPVALQDAEATTLLPGMDEERMLASAHLVTPDGRIYSGGDAAAPLARLLPGGRALSVITRVFPVAVRRGAYEWVARNRGPFGRRVPDRAKQRATARIDAHR